MAFFLPVDFPSKWWGGHNLNFIGSHFDEIVLMWYAYHSSGNKAGRVVDLEWAKRNTTQVLKSDTVALVIFATFPSTCWGTPLREGVLEGLKMLSTLDRFGPEYASLDDTAFIPKYRASCFCGTVRYEVSSDPVDAKICHCLACRKLHGAPMQWSAIFYKHHVRFIAGVDQLLFFNSEQGLNERILPCKVSCSRCGAPIADEGRRMWLAFPPLFDFEDHAGVPDSFKPTCHIFYGMRVLDIPDDLPKWSGHKNHSVLL